jgi:hypothetical protein
MTVKLSFSRIEAPKKIKIQITFIPIIPLSYNSIISHKGSSIKIA